MRWKKSPEASLQSGLRANAPAFAILSLLATIPYLNTLLNGFVYDDNFQVVGNPYVHSFHHLRQIFTTTVWSFQGAQGVTNYYRPMMTFGYLICYQLFGPVPFGYHLVNIALNAWVVCLVFWVAQRMLGDRFAAFVAAGMFALHPIHTESVAWIAGVTDLELAAFYLLTFSLYLNLSARPREAHPRPKFPRRLAMGGVFVLALLSKEQALTLPALATVYEHFFRDDREATSIREKASRYLPLWGLAGLYLLIRLFFLGGLAVVLSRLGLTRKEIVLSAIALAGQYLRKLIWPAHLSAFYVFYESSQISDPRVLLGLGGIILCGAAFLWLWKNARTPAFFLLWMGATLAPVLNARWMPASVFAERYLYLPSAGFCWLVGWAVGRIRANARIPVLARATLALAVGVAGLAGGIATVRRNRDWRSDQALYLKTLATNPDSGAIRLNLGTVYFNTGDQAAAEREWIQALAAGPRNVFTLINFGLLREKQGRYFESQEFFERAIRIRPDEMDAHLFYAQMLESIHRDVEADWQYRLAVTLAPYASNAHSSYGQFLYHQGRWQDAQTQFVAAVRDDPVPEAYDGLGDLYRDWKQLAQAEQSFRLAVKYNPFDSHAHFALGAIAAATGRTAEAVREYTAGLETDPTNAEALSALHKLQGGK
jgi:Tfp pilus assembly protein PilF